MPSKISNISPPKKATAWTITLKFDSKRKAKDFLEDMHFSKDAGIVASLAYAARESRQGKARPIEELYKKYGV